MKHQNYLQTTSPASGPSYRPTPEAQPRKILRAVRQVSWVSLISPNILRKNQIKFVSTATNFASWEERKFKDKDIYVLPRGHMLFYIFARQPDQAVKTWKLIPERVRTVPFHSSPPNLLLHENHLRDAKISG